MQSANVELVKRVYEIFAQGNMAEFMALLDPDIIAREADSMPYGGTYRGLKEFNQVLAKVAQTWEYFRPAPERYFAQGDQVMVVLRLKARSRATGKVVDMPMAELWTLRNGKIAGVQPFYWDTAEVVRVTTPAQAAEQAV
jgi:uncharacterized protein